MVTDLRYAWVSTLVCWSRSGRQELVMSARSQEPWADDEIGATVEAYFRLRNGDETGTKVSIYRRLAHQFPQRTTKAFERKFRNISAVLQELGIDWVPGLRPLANYQQALREAVERYLAL